MSDATYNRLKAVAKAGIAENWSRVGPRAVRLSNGVRYDVRTAVAEAAGGKDVEIEYYT